MKELILRIKVLFFGLPKIEPVKEKCKRCERLIDKSAYYKDRYTKTKLLLQESQEMLKLAEFKLDKDNKEWI